MSTESSSVAAVALVLAVYLIVFTHLWYDFHALSDTSLYFRYALLMQGGMHPYADFLVEYPPLAVPLFAMADLVTGSVQDIIGLLYRAAGQAAPVHSGVEWYTLSFNVLMMTACALAAAVTAAAAATLWRGRLRPGLSAAAFAVGVAATGAILANRYDVVVALVLAVALWCLARRWWPGASLVLGLGFALKLTPAILLPLIFVLAPGRRDIGRSSACFALGALLPFVPYAIHGLSGLEYVFRYHLERPLQIESVLATPLLIGRLTHTLSVEVGSSYGSQYIAATGAETLASLSGLFTLAALAGAYALIWRRRERLRSTPALVPVAVFTLVLAFMTFGKVLSPQFFIWTLPLVALVIVERRAIGFAALAIMALTQVEFPANYWQFVYLQDGAIAIVVARNLALLALFIHAMVSLWRLPAGAAADEPSG